MIQNSLGALSLPFASFEGRPQANASRKPDVAAHHEAEHQELDDDRLSVGQTPDAQIAVPGGASVALRLKSDLRVKQTADDGLRITSKTRLKFDYVFQSDDGTTIRLSAKAKTRLSYTENGDGSFEFKTRVKYRISAAIETVQSGLAPALESDQVTGEQNSAISTALRQFGDLVNQVTTQFLDNSLPGDDLIANVVGAFNDLTRSVQSELPQDQGGPIAVADQPPLDLSAGAVDSSANPVAAPDQPVPPQPVPPQAAPPEAVPAVGTTTGPNQTQRDPAVTPDAAESVSRAAGRDAVTDHGGLVEGETDHPHESVTKSDDAETVEPTRPSPGRSLFVDLRVSFVQSLSSLVSFLNSPSSATNTPLIGTSVRSRSRLDLSLAVYGQTKSVNDTPPGIIVDARV